MTTHIAPDATGAWEITTASGAVYELRVPPDARASIVRLPDDHALDDAFDPSQALRRDGSGIAVLSWCSWSDTLGLLPGIAVGMRVLLLLEPLGTGDVTRGETTPVVSIRELDAPGVPVLTH